MTPAPVTHTYFTATNAVFFDWHSGDKWCVTAAKITAWLFVFFIGIVTFAIDLYYYLHPKTPNPNPPQRHATTPIHYAHHMRRRPPAKTFWTTGKKITAAAIGTIIIAGLYAAYIWGRAPSLPDNQVALAQPAPQPFTLTPVQIKPMKLRVPECLISSRADTILSRILPATTPVAPNNQVAHYQQDDLFSRYSRAVCPIPPPVATPYNQVALAQPSYQPTPSRILPATTPVAPNSQVALYQPDDLYLSYSHAVSPIPLAERMREMGRQFATGFSSGASQKCQTTLSALKTGGNAVNSVATATSQCTPGFFRGAYEKGQDTIATTQTLLKTSENAVRSVATATSQFASGISTGAYEKGQATLATTQALLETGGNAIRSVSTATSQFASGISTGAYEKGQATLATTQALPKTGENAVRSVATASSQFAIGFYRGASEKGQDTIATTQTFLKTSENAVRSVATASSQFAIGFYRGASEKCHEINDQIIRPATTIARYAATPLTARCDTKISSEAYAEWNKQLDEYGQRVRDAGMIVELNAALNESHPLSVERECLRQKLLALGQENCAWQKTKGLGQGIFNGISSAWSSISDWWSIPKGMTREECDNHALCCSWHHGKPSINSTHPHYEETQFLRRWYFSRAWMTYFDGSLAGISNFAKRDCTCLCQQKGSSYADCSAIYFPSPPS